MLLPPVPLAICIYTVPDAGSLRSQKVQGYTNCGRLSEKGTLSMQPWRSHVIIHTAMKLPGGTDVWGSPTLL